MAADEADPYLFDLLDPVPLKDISGPYLNKAAYFGTATGAPGYKLEPVDHDPFSTTLKPGGYLSSWNYNQPDEFGMYPTGGPLAESVAAGYKNSITGPGINPLAYYAGHFARGLTDWTGSFGDVVQHPERYSQEQIADIGAGSALNLIGMGTTFAGAGAIPNGSFGSFGGPGAVGADLANLAKARELHATGADRMTIWNQTGWYQWPDGAWTYRIPDTNLTAQPGQGVGIGVDSPTQHPDLLSAYPDLDSVEVYNSKAPSRSGGYSGPATGAPGQTIMSKGPTNEQIRSNAGHELSHAVDDLEERSVGGSEQLPDVIKMADDAMAARRQEIMNELAPIASKLDDHIQDRTRNGNLSYDDAEEEFWAKNHDDHLKYQELTDELGSMNPARYREGTYMRLVGEARARTVQRELQYPERLQPSTRYPYGEPPWHFMDMKPEQLITRQRPKQMDRNFMGSGLWGRRLKEEPDIAPPFFHQSARFVENLKQESASPDQWRGVLRNAKQYGVSPEELGWLGVDDWLSKQKGPVSKQDVLGYIRAHELNVHEVARSDNTLTKDQRERIEEHVMNAEMEARYHWASDQVDSDGVDYRKPSKPNIEENEDGGWTVELPWLKDQHPDNFRSFGDYHMAEEWADKKHSRESDDREMEARYRAIEDMEERWNPSDAEFDYAQARHDAMSRLGINKSSLKYDDPDYTFPGGDDYTEFLLTLPDRRQPGPKTFDEWQRANVEDPRQYDSAEARTAYSRWMLDNRHIWDNNKNFVSPHWDEPNVLAHVRFDSRSIDGKNTLFLQELQSDWHQQGRKLGYRDPNDEPPRIDPDKLPLKAIVHPRREPDPSAASAVSLKYGMAREQATEVRTADGTDGHYVTTLYGDWPADKAIAEARRRLKSGELPRLQQAVDSAFYNQPPAGPFSNKWHELALKRMLRYAAEHGYQQLAWTPGELQTDRFGHEEGMKGFYDQIMPAAVNKITRPFGAEVRRAPVYGDRLDHKYSAHVVDITPELRQQAMQQGFPIREHEPPIMHPDAAQYWRENPPATHDWFNQYLQPGEPANKNVDPREAWWDREQTGFMTASRTLGTDPKDLGSHPEMWINAQYLAKATGVPFNHAFRDLLVDVRRRHADHAANVAETARASAAARDRSAEWHDWPEEQQRQFTPEVIQGDRTAPRPRTAPQFDPTTVGTGQRVSSDNVVMHVDPRAIVRAHRATDPEFAKLMAGRTERAEEHAFAGKPFSMPELGVVDGRLGFTNGRHRTYLAADAGVKSMPVAVDRQSVKAFRKLLAKYAIEPVE